MFKRVVVGIDGETSGSDALALATRLVDDGGKLVRVHVPDGRNVGAGLHRAAETARADLIVVGSGRHGRPGRVFLGDHMSQALDGAPCAVAIAPRGYGNHASALTEVGVAFNGSPESRRAVELTRTLAAERRARLSAFEAVEPPPGAITSGPARSVGDVAGDDVAGEDVAGDGLAAARRRIALLGDDVDTYTAAGDPIRQLAIFSDSVDLLVAGARGYGPVGRLVHGSTTRKLARVARCPLLILVRSAAESTSETGCAGVCGLAHSGRCGVSANVRNLAATGSRLVADAHDPHGREHASVAKSDSISNTREVQIHVTQSF